MNNICDMIYLTNGGCESTGHVTPLELAKLGLDFGNYDTTTGKIVDELTEHGEFYPLNALESRFIAEDSICRDDFTEIRFGYSVLALDRKWLAPHLIYYFRPENDEFSPFAKDANLPTREEAASAAAAKFASLSVNFLNFGGKVTAAFDAESDRHEIVLLIPMEGVEKTLQSLQAPLTFDAYKSWVDSLTA